MSVLLVTSSEALVGSERWLLGISPIRDVVSLDDVASNSMAMPLALESGVLNVSDGGGCDKNERPFVFLLRRIVNLTLLVVGFRAPDNDGGDNDDDDDGANDEDDDNDDCEEEDNGNDDDSVFNEDNLFVSASPPLDESDKDNNASRKDEEDKAADKDELRREALPW